MPILFESEHARLEHDPARRIVRFTRSSVPFATVDVAATTFRAIAAAPAHIDRATHGLLTDLRSAPGRNDPAFEAVISRFRAEIFKGFARRATLVKTMAGALQVQRIGREQHSLEVRVFQDEMEALEYLSGR